MIASGYTLHLYCDVPVPGWEHLHQGEFSHGPGVGVYSDEERRACRAAARRDGWLVDYGTGRAVCPECVKAGRARSPGPVPGTDDPTNGSRGEP